MMNIKFYPSSSGVITVPIVQTEHFEENEDGSLRKLKPIITKYKTIPDRRDQQTLKVFRADKNVVMNSLSWITNQPLSFSVDKWVTNERHYAEIVEQTGEILEIPLPGYFEPPFEGPEAVHEICEMHRLLGQYFSTYQDVFKVRLAENQVTRSILDFLVESHQEMAEALGKMGKEIKPLPPWLKLTLELRKQG